MNEGKGFQLLTRNQELESIDLSQQMRMIRCYAEREKRITRGNSDTEEMDERLRAHENDVLNLESTKNEICDEIRELGEEQREKQYNMPESLQQSETGELLERRADSMDQWADELDSVDVEINEEREDFESDEEWQQHLSDELDRMIDELTSCEPEIE